MNNSQLPHQDATRPIDERVEDLLSRMTLEEKAGEMFHTMIGSGPLDQPDPMFALPTAVDYVTKRHMTHFNLLGVPATATDLARWHNEIQQLAASTRLGIPVTISSDPRSAFSSNPGAAMMAGPFSQWPETLGLAALRDSELVERFADIVRREYLAVGIRVALHPQVDLATEPRWARQNGTFGEDADLTSRLGAAYIRGFQGGSDGIGAESVACMVKHFPGGGPQRDGEDPHFEYGREQVYPGGQFDLHLKPFEAAFAAGVSQVMPYYGMPVGTAYEEVGFSFNKGIVTGLLREKYGFDGIVCTDWGLLTDQAVMGQAYPARAWGVEQLAVPQRAAKILAAGVDQFGGEACPEVVVELVRSGAVPETRLDASVRRLLREKFLLGLFDQRFVDVDAAGEIVGCEQFRAEGRAIQRAALTVLTNGSGTLPLTAGKKVYVEGINAELAEAYGTVVTDPAEADVAVVRTVAPWEPRESPFESFFHAGSLEFSNEERERLSAITATVPTVIVIYLDRPAILGWLADRAAALIAEFGADDAAVLDVVFGRATAHGRLPFDVPSSMTAVVDSRPDVPFDTADPTFRFGDGMDI